MNSGITNYFEKRLTTTKGQRPQFTTADNADHSQTIVWPLDPKIFGFRVFLRGGSPWAKTTQIKVLLSRYYFQNTHFEDYWTVSMLFCNQLKDRGWDGAILEPIFVMAHEKIVSHSRKKTIQTIKEKSPSCIWNIILMISHESEFVISGRKTVHS